MAEEVQAQFRMERALLTKVYSEANRSRALRIGCLLLLPLVPLIGVLGSAPLEDLEARHWLSWFGSLVVLFPAALIGLSIGEKSAASLAISRIPQQHLGIEHTLTFSDEGFRISSSLGASKNLWAAFSHWRETPSFFLVYLQAGVFHFVPKAALRNDEQTGCLRDILQRNLARR